MIEGTGMTDKGEIIVICVLTIILVGIIVVTIMEENNSCIKYTAEQHYSVDEISKLCGVGK